MRSLVCVTLLFVLAAICHTQTVGSGGPKRLSPPPDGCKKVEYWPNGMVLIPAGKFEMGDHQGVGHYDEYPVHNVYLDSFFVDSREVTNKSYCAFLNSAYSQGLISVFNGVVTNYSVPYCNTTSSSIYSRITWNGIVFGVLPRKNKHPMLDVSWYGAAAYANWRSVQDGLTPCYDELTWKCDYNTGGYRLPTEAEWEYAARGGEHNPYYKYPWGNDIDGSKANYLSSGDPFETGPMPHTTPVGYYNGNQIPPGVDMSNGYGLYDIAGDVWEWCNDWYDGNYYKYSKYKNPHGPASGVYRVARGGSWEIITYALRCAIRSGAMPPEMYEVLGFRLVLMK